VSDRPGVYYIYATVRTRFLRKSQPIVARDLNFTSNDWCDITINRKKPPKAAFMHQRECDFSQYRSDFLNNFLKKHTREKNAIIKKIFHNINCFYFHPHEHPQIRNEVMDSYCIICNDEITSGTGQAVVLTLKGAVSINEACRERGDCVKAVVGNMVHMECRRDYCDKKRIENLLQHCTIIKNT